MIVWKSWFQFLFVMLLWFDCFVLFLCLIVAWEFLFGFVSNVCMFGLAFLFNGCLDVLVSVLFVMLLLFGCFVLFLCLIAAWGFLVGFVCNVCMFGLACFV